MILYIKKLEKLLHKFSHPVNKKGKYLKKKLLNGKQVEKNLFLNSKKIIQHY